MDFLGNGRSSWVSGGMYHRNMFSAQIVQTMAALG
jgi:hypothetical protein